MPRRRPRGSSGSPVTLPLDIFPTQDEITSRAHALFIAGGRQVASISEYRLQAEQELLEIGARRALGTPTRRRSDALRAPSDRPKPS